MNEKKRMTRKNKRMLIFSIIAVVLIAATSIFLFTHNGNGPIDKNGDPAKKGEMSQDIMPGDEGEDSDGDEADSEYSREYDPQILYATAWSHEENGVKEIYMFSEIGDCFYGTVRRDTVSGDWWYTTFSTGQIILDPYGPEATDESSSVEGLHDFEIKNNNTAIKIDNVEYKLDDYNKWVNLPME